MVLETEPLACREYTRPREDQKIQNLCNGSKRTIIGPVLEAHVIRYLGISGAENSDILCTTTKERTSRVVICRGTHSYVEELRINDPDHNPTSSELLLGKICCKEREFGSTKMEQSSTEETHATQLKFRQIHCAINQK